ncbi:uncharacterized protein LOC111089178 [Limulus polyphemus]|uniref:Uncharacterized protein LOC111089178 n=1 Tax=Limulus polyphemus TaxID=6850 RepID=A0ABM1TLV9_LIMPO|nr:uncharacterized protein LOC111089178 [Limulus polyphemus]
MIQVLLPLFCALCLADSSAPFYKINPDGSRLLQYEAGTLARRNFREEVTNPDGSVVGRYGFHDPTGHLHVVQYHSGSHGYVAKGDAGVYYGSTEELGTTGERKKDEEVVKEDEMKDQKQEGSIIEDDDSMDEGENAKKENAINEDATEDMEKDTKDKETDAVDKKEETKDKEDDAVDKKEDAKDASTSDDEKTVKDEMKDEKDNKDSENDQSNPEEPYEKDPEITALFPIPEYGRRRLTIGQSDKTKDEEEESRFYSSGHIFNVPLSSGFPKWYDPRNQPLTWPHPIFRLQDSSTGQYVPFEHPWILEKSGSKEKDLIPNTYPFNYVGSLKKESTSQVKSDGAVTTTTFQYAHPSHFYYPQPILPFVHRPKKSPFLVPGYSLYA